MRHKFGRMRWEISRENDRANPMCLYLIELLRTILTLGVEVCQIAVRFDEPRMSAFGYKRTFTHTVIYVRFTPESRHYRRKIGSVPESRLLVSALPPKADPNGYGAGCPLMTQSGH